VVSDTDAAVGPAITLELHGTLLLEHFQQSEVVSLPEMRLKQWASSSSADSVALADLVLWVAPGLDAPAIVDMHVAAFDDRLCRLADHLAIFQYLLILLDRAHCELVAGGHVGQR